MTSDAAARPDPIAPPPGPQILPLGLDGVLLRFSTQFSQAANGAARSLAADLQANPLPGQLDCAPALASVVLRFDRAQTDLAAVQAALAARLARPAPGAPLRPAGRLWRVPAAFGGARGAQLAEVAHLLGQPQERLVQTLCATELSVLAIGFAPGQPYLGLMPPDWDLPRQPGLTPRVPPGTIVTALRQIVLFAQASPTGWRALGQCAFRPFQPDAATPFPLAPGDRLRFAAVSEPELAALEASGDPMGGARAEPAP